jgi:hypothetical protein
MDKINEKDIGLKEDLIECLKNLVCIESHSQASFYISGEKRWLELRDGIREIRSKWMDTIVKKENSEIWCISKHLMKSITSMEEVAIRLKDTTEGIEANKDAGILTGLLFELNDIKTGGK